MRRIAKLACLSALLAFSFAPAADKIRIAVMNLVAKAGVDPNTASTITDLLSGELVSLKKFDVVDRAKAYGMPGEIVDVRGEKTTIKNKEYPDGFVLDQSYVSNHSNDNARLELKNNESRGEIVVIFLAILHLIKYELVQVEQSHHFGEMKIVKKDEAKN